MTDHPKIDPPLAGKTAMVTGSSSGIGRAIAIELARRGADIILHGRRPSGKLNDVKTEIETLGRKTHTVFGDFFQLDALDDFVAQAWNWRNQIDIWVNNAGGDVLTGSWANKPLDEKLDFLWKVDVRATLLLSRIVGNRMLDRYQDSGEVHPGKYSILNMGWDQAWIGMAGDSGELFATTKGAIMSMSLSLAKSLAPAVRVNCLAPGWIQTAWGDKASEYWAQRAQGESLMDRWGTAEDVARAAAFLCSQDANFIAGQVIPINGGFRFAKQDGVAW